MGSKERKETHKQNIRASILKTARDMVANGGWQGVSIRKLASAIEYTAPIIYEHFENKDALLRELISDGFRRMLQKIEKTINKSLSQKKQLYRFANAYFDFASKNCDLYQLMFWSNYNVQYNLPTDLKKIIGVFRNYSKEPYIENNVPNRTDELIIDLLCIIHGYISLGLISKIPEINGKTEKFCKRAIKTHIKSMF